MPKIDDRESILIELSRDENKSLTVKRCVYSNGTVLPKNTKIPDELRENLDKLFEKLKEFLEQTVKPVDKKGIIQLRDL